MAYQVLYSTQFDVKRRQFMTKQQVLAYLWSLDTGRETLITIADLVSLQATCGTRQKLIEILGKIGGLDELFED